MSTFTPTTLVDVNSSAGEFRHTSTNGSVHTYTRYEQNGNIDAGNTISYNESDYKWRDVNTSDHPGGFVVNTSSTYSSGTFTATSTATGTANAEFIHLSNHYGVYWFTIPMNGWSSSGPTVTSITVANEIANTRQFTVTHTGSLTASDIDYKINGVDITSLGSPNTPITNLQTTSTGSTFDSYTVAKNGTHFIKIGTKVLTFYVSTSNSARSPLSNSDLSVTFPTTKTEWLQHVSNNYNDVYLYTTSVVYHGHLSYGSGDFRIIEYLRIGTSYQTNGFYWKLETWDFATPDSNTGESYTYTSSTGYVDPVALLESTNSPNTTIPVSANFLTNSTFDWNFASENAQAPTSTSNGGGKRRRYPIISTNLFDRQKSIFSIGLTHKDETLF